MKPKFLIAMLCIFLLPAISSTVNAQDFTFKFINPAFGGDTFNYNWLLSSAQEQNTYEDPDAELNQSQSSLKDFTENFNRMVLNQLSKNLFDQQFGESGLQEGSYLLGDFQINVTDTGSGLEIVIIDMLTYDQTIINIPYY